MSDTGDGSDDPHDRGAARLRELDRLRGIYLDALACTDGRAADARFVRSRASLGAILEILGGLPDIRAARPTPRPGSGA